MEISSLSKNFLNNNDNLENVNINLINFSEFNNLADDDFKIEVNKNLLLYKNKAHNTYEDEFIKFNKFYRDNHYDKINNLNNLPKYVLFLKKDEQ